MAPDWTSTRALLRGLACATPTRARAQEQVQRPHLYRQSWYESLLRSLNPTDFDYGRWLEERRQMFLDATTRQPQFWYSLAVTLLCVFLILYLWKRILDEHRQWRSVAAMMADVYSHDLFSRHLARDAVAKHNQHIETCNRAFESAEAGEGRPGWGETHAESLKAELERVTAQLEATTQERNKLQEELRQKSVIVSDLSLRIDAVSRKVNGGATAGKDGGTVVVDHINRLQEELYTERQKNKRLKG